MSCTRLQVTVDISKLPPRHGGNRTHNHIAILKTPEDIITESSSILLTKKFAVVILYSYFPALFDHTINIAWELVSNVNASVTMDLQKHIADTTNDFRKE